MKRSATSKPAPRIVSVDQLRDVRGGCDYCHGGDGGVLFGRGGDGLTPVGRDILIGTGRDG